MDAVTLTQTGAAASSKEKRNLLLFSAGMAVSLLGTYIYSFAVSLYVLRVTGSGTSFAFSILLGTLPRVFLSTVAGSVADRVDRKRLIVGLDFLSGAILLALLGFSRIYGLQLPFVYGTTLLLAIISTFFNTGFTAAIPRLVSDDRLMKINAYRRAIESASQILGPILGGMIFSLISIKFFLLVNGISFILSALSELFIDFEFNKSTEEQKPAGSVNLNTLKNDVLEVVAFIKNHKLMRLIMPFSISINFLISASLSVVLPFMINNVLKMTSSQYGIIEGAFSVGMLIAAIIIGRLPEKEKKLRGLSGAILGMGASIIVMGLPGLSILKNFPVMVTFGIYTVTAFLFALCLLFMDMPLTVVVQRSIPAHMLGRVWGVVGTVSAALSPLGILLAGVTLDIIPAYFFFFVLGVCLIGMAIFVYKNKIIQEY